jgi:hypothetical protein
MEADGPLVMIFANDVVLAHVEYAVGPVLFNIRLSGSPAQQVWSSCDEFGC